MTPFTDPELETRYQIHMKNILPDNLSPSGFNCSNTDFKRIDEDKIIMCMKWLSENAKTTPKINPLYSSYLLKHVIERYVGEYIPNGALIACAIIMGYQYELTHSGVNARFNMHVNKNVIEAVGRII